ncbi:MAG: hypothetical protein HQK50_01990 [Oligoflexia bacterium]|nr:hypothetical protein [Oligoflexia bacterium]
MITDLLLYYSGLSSVIALSLLFIGLGHLTLKRTLNSYEQFHLLYKHGLAFCTGLGLFIIFHRISTVLLSNSFYSFYLTLIASVAYLFFLEKDLLRFLKKNWQRSGKKLAILLLIFLVFERFVFMAMVTVSENGFADIGSHLGTGHTQSYANIASYIFSAEYIYPFDKNYFQSILATFQMYLGLKIPYLALHFWRATLLYMTALMGYGFLRQFHCERWPSLFGMTALLFGSSSFTFLYIISVVTGYPLFLSIYADSVVALPSSLLLIVMLEALYSKKMRSQFFTLTIISTQIMMLIISAMQVNLLLLVTLSAYLLYRIYLHGSTYWQRDAGILLFCIFITFLGTLQGGPLAPKEFQSRVEVPGVAPAAQEHSTGQTMILPEATSNFLYVGHDPDKKPKGCQGGVSVSTAGLFANRVAPLSVAMPFLLSSGVQKEIFLTIYETQFWLFLKLVFWPLLLLTLALSLYKNKTLHFNYFFTTLFFSVGSVVSFLFSSQGDKWIFTRFLYPGMSLSVLIGILAIDSLFKEKFKEKKRRLWALVILSILGVFMIYGPSRYAVENALCTSTFYGDLIHFVLTQN